jgi:hypothetical protein
MTGIRDRGSEPSARSRRRCASPVAAAELAFRRGKLSFSEDTTAPHGKTAGLAAKQIRRGNAASVTQLASLRCHISKRPAVPKRGCSEGKFGSSRRVFLPAPLRVCFRKPLPAR